MPVNPCFLSQVSNKDFEKSLTQEERSAFWKYAKSIGADKGVGHEAVIAKMAQDFNMPERLVATALNGPKSLRKASEMVRYHQRNSARFLAENTRYLETLDQTGTGKLMSFLNDGTRRALLFSHGPVPPVTHAIDVLTTNPVEFLKMYGRGFQALSPRATERIMVNLESQPNFKLFHDAGAPIGRDALEGFYKTGWAGRAMDAALKPLRYNLMEAKWERLSKANQTPEMAKHLAQEFAHATGALVKGEKIDIVTRGFRKLLLAPQLTPSKFAKSLFDPYATYKTFERVATSRLSGGRIRAATPEERIIAYNRLRRAATYFGVTLGALAVNQAVLQSLGSNQQVNFTKPERSDFLAFKFAGQSWRMRGTLEIVALLAKLGALSTRKGKYGQSAEEAAFKYGEYKFAPGIGLGKELLTRKDVFGRPVPWSKELGKHKFPRKNYIEFIGEHGPIFVGHGISAFHETLRDQGVDTRDSMNVIRAVTSGKAGPAIASGLLHGGTEFFGINVQPDRYIGK